MRRTVASMMESGEGRTKLLIVDDDPEICALLRLRFEKRGYHVDTASDGEQAVDQARALHPALIILDVMMPKKTGWEVVRDLRHDDATKDIKIVMLTAIGQQVNELTAPLYGVEDHLDKPFEFAELERRVAALLA